MSRTRTLVPEGLPTTEEAPPGPTRILDAAERLFAIDGFSGAAMKAIAVEAGVAQGILQYHFASTDGLYATVVARRSGLINAAHPTALASVDLAAPDALEKVFAAFAGPPLGRVGGGVDHARIPAKLGVGVACDRALVAKHHDPVARRFIASLRVAEPRVDRALAAWACSFALAALIGVASRDRQPERLAGQSDAETSESGLDRLVAFCASGLRTMLPT